MREAHKYEKFEDKDGNVLVAVPLTTLNELQDTACEYSLVLSEFGLNIHGYKQVRHLEQKSLVSDEQDRMFRAVKTVKESMNHHG